MRAGSFSPFSAGRSHPSLIEPVALVPIRSSPSLNVEAVNWALPSIWVDENETWPSNTTARRSTPASNRAPRAYSAGSWAPRSTSGTVNRASSSRTKGHCEFEIAAATSARRTSSNETPLASSALPLDTSWRMRSRSSRARCRRHLADEITRAVQELASHLRSWPRSSEGTGWFPAVEMAMVEARGVNGGCRRERGAFSRRCRLEHPASRRSSRTAHTDQCGNRGAARRRARFGLRIVASDTRDVDAQPLVP